MDGFKLRRRYRRDLGAVVAVEVLDIFRPNERVEPGTVAEMYMAKQSLLLEQLKVAVHGGLIERQGPRETHRRHRTVGGKQRLQNESARGRQTPA